MEAYGALLSNVAKTVDQFMGDNITDNQARDWFGTALPGPLPRRNERRRPGVKVRETDQPKPNFQTDLA